MLCSLERIERKGRKNRLFSIVSSSDSVECQGKEGNEKKVGGRESKRDLFALLLLMLAVGFKWIKGG